MRGIQITSPKYCRKSVLVFSSLLPPKKLIGSKEPAFIMKRRRELEAYLQVVIIIPCFPGVCQVDKLDVLQDTCFIRFDFSKAACHIFFHLQAVCHFLERNLSPHLTTFLDLGQVLLDIFFILCLVML